MDVGAQIKDYRVVEHIGRGGMADVWSARDQKLSRMVAIKSIARDFTSDKDPVALFEREARTIAALEHPHILPIYDFGEFEGKLYIVMRYVTGGSLEDRLRQGVLPISDALDVARSVAAALEYAHTNNVIHLDLKPPNILLDTQNAPYLADFGLAAVVGPEGRVQNPGAGTLHYMAPEQMTADELDRRCDVYSFSVMMFRILTGQLPFNASAPLAIQQLQRHEMLPPLESVNSELPPEVTDVLRRGTAVEPDERPDHLSELVEELSAVLGMSTSIPRVEVDPNAVTVSFGDTSLFTAPEQVQKREARDLYEQARLAWAEGRGRFLLGVSHFMVMSDFYADADDNGLETDEAGLQMLLRGAIEYDHELAFWWSKVEGYVSRRWVCLHAIRSASAPARVRALQRLETLPDSDPPQIPAQVAQTLQMESNQVAQLAALNVLASRAQFYMSRDDLNVNTDHRERLLSTASRQKLVESTEAVWQETTFSPEIDRLVADLALDLRAPAVSELAARVIGRMRSTLAVRALLNARDAGQKGSLRALALVRDEVPTLPDEVPPAPRIYAWLANTWRRIAVNPMQHVWVFLFALFGGWLAMGQLVYRTFRSQAVFNQQRIGNMLAVGLFFGLLTGLLVLLALQLPSRLRGFWPLLWRFAWSVLFALGLSSLMWGSYVWLYLQQPTPPPVSVMLLVCIGTAIGIVIPAVWRVPGWVAASIAAVGVYVPLWLSFTSWWRQIFLDQSALLGLSPEAFIILFDRYEQVYTVLIPFVLLLVIGMHLPALVADGRQLFTAKKPEPVTPAPQKVAPPTDDDLATQVLAGRAPETEHVAVEHVRDLAHDTDLPTVTDVPGTEEYESDRVGARGAARRAEEAQKGLETDPDLNTIVGDQDDSKG